MSKQQSESNKAATQIANHSSRKDADNPEQHNPDNTSRLPKRSNCNDASFIKMLNTARRSSIQRITIGNINL